MGKTNVSEIWTSAAQAIEIARSCGQSSNLKRPRRHTAFLMSSGLSLYSSRKTDFSTSSNRINRLMPRLKTASPADVVGGLVSQEGWSQQNPKLLDSVWNPRQSCLALSRTPCHASAFLCTSLLLFVYRRASRKWQIRDPLGSKILTRKATQNLYEHKTYVEHPRRNQYKN